MTDLSCPACGSEFDLATAFASEEDRQALARLVAVSVPMGARVLQYIGLHTPAKQRLTSAKKIKLILQLLPDLERQAVAHKGRDWSVPLTVWAAAIDQLLAQRAAGRLELPLKGHGYLYAVLAGMADKVGEQAEQQRDQELRHAVRPNAGVPVDLSRLANTQDPALAALQERDRQATPMPEEIRQRLATLRGKGA